MDLEMILRVIGWALVILPLAAFEVIMLFMAVKIAEDEPAIKTLLTLGVTLFTVGAVILVLSYFTDMLAFL